MKSVFLSTDASAGKLRFFFAEVERDLQTFSVSVQKNLILPEEADRLDKKNKLISSQFYFIRVKLDNKQ